MPSHSSSLELPSSQPRHEGRVAFHFSSSFPTQTNRYCQVDNKSNDYAFMCISVGDCKALHYSQSSQRLSDITYGSRANSKDAKDCGGRLGPYIGKKGDPDLRNKAFYYTAVKPGL
jgi:hypothetical protein